MRLVRTARLPLERARQEDLSTPSLSSRDLPPSPLFTQTAKVGVGEEAATILHPLQRNPSLQETGRQL